MGFTSQPIEVSSKIRKGPQENVLHQNIGHPTDQVACTVYRWTVVGLICIVGAGIAVGVTTSGEGEVSLGGGAGGLWRWRGALAVARGALRRREVLGGGEGSDETRFLTTPNSAMPQGRRNLRYTYQIRHGIRWPAAAGRNITEPTTSRIESYLTIGSDQINAITKRSHGTKI